MSSWNKHRSHARDKPVVPRQSMLVPFSGTAYRLADNWMQAIPLHEYQNRPIQYLEIGTFYGANLLSVATSYGRHPDSTLHCIDPWEDYDAYSEYKGQQSSIYDTFCTNIEESTHMEKITVHRGYSHAIVPTLPDDSFDIIYIDGNHEPDYVLEDAVLSFRKLKQGGILIFDDYGWGGPDLTQRGIDGFLSGYHKRMTVLGSKEMQVFIKKL